jgi:hypothetical protein
MAEHNLVEGGLKENLVTLADNDLFTGHSTAMTHICDWLRWQQENGQPKSIIRAARQTAAELGIPGASLDAVATELAKTYTQWSPPAG